MLLLAVGQLGVDLVVDDHDVRVLQHLRDGLVVRARHDAAGGVVGVGQDQRLGFRRDGGAQRLGGQLEGVLHVRGDGHAFSAREGDTGHVGDIAGVGHQHLVAGLHQRADGQIDALAGAHRDQNLVLRVVLRAEALRLIAGDPLPQLQEAPVAGVVGVAGAQGIDGRVGVVPGGAEVRFAHAQGHHVVHHIDDVEKFSYARRRHIGHPAAKYLIVIHGVTFNRRSSVVSSIRTP